MPLPPDPDDARYAADVTALLAGRAYAAEADVTARAPRFAEAIRALLTVPSVATAWRRFREHPTVAAPLAFAASAVYSSNIEGNPVSFGDFLRSRERGAAPAPRRKDIAEIEALEAAYAWASSRTINEANLLAAHGRFAEPLLGTDGAGRYRTAPVAVYSPQGIVYAAADPADVPALMRAYFASVKRLLNAPLNAPRTFYHAAMLHLVFAHIHPFEDGNGRAARLVEKWFLARKLGQTAWRIPSEAYYWRNRPLYYDALRVTGPDFEYLDYARGVPFLSLLPRSLAFTPS